MAPQSEVMESRHSKTKPVVESNVKRLSTKLPEAWVRAQQARTNTHTHTIVVTRGRQQRGLNYAERSQNAQQLTPQLK